MQRPPQFPGILSSRQAYQWVNRLDRKHQELAARPLAAAARDQIRDQQAAEFAEATPALEQVSRRREEADASRRLLAALRLVEDRIRTYGRQAGLTVELLTQLHDPTGETGLRAGEAAGSSVRAEHLPLVLETACRWFAMDSIAELNPVEQAAIALLRLLEISPFETANERTALVAASLFTMRAGLPPIIIRPHRAPEFSQARGEGLGLNTRPMVELIAASVEESLDRALKDHPAQP